jgi:cell division septum initiation protein DivIVA
VSTSACKTDKFRELDDRERRAWSSYCDRIRELTGDEYERAESEQWEQLQRELQTVQRRRHSLASASG